MWWRRGPWGHHGPGGHRGWHFDLGLPPFFFRFRPWRPYPRREDYIRMLEEYRDELQEELKEVEEELAELKKE